MDCEVLGPLGKVAPLGDFGFWGIRCSQWLGLDIRGTLAMDVEIDESMYSCLEELGPSFEVASESLSWRREGSSLSCNS